MTFACAAVCNVPVKVVPVSADAVMIPTVSILLWSMVTPVPIIAFPTVETPETFKLPLTSASVTVAIPVLMLGTSSSPNNLPVNTTSPLIV